MEESLPETRMSTPLPSGPLSRPPQPDRSPAPTACPIVVLVAEGDSYRVREQVPGRGAGVPSPAPGRPAAPGVVMRVKRPSGFVL